MEEEGSIPQDHQELQKEKVQRSGRLFFKSLWKFIQETLSLKDGIDMNGTMEGIRNDVEFKGHGAWILVCSIMIASIGLSIGNIPIIVGAMLISPLMGPILGIGLAAGTNDFELLIKSLKDFGISVVISVLISWLYFLIIPQPEINLELEGRKEATLLAIAVAFFGGSAGIIAGSRKLKNNVVPGVAIATALMPPLCTVGFGLATLRWDFVTGALYLFGINSVFIALPTYFYIKYLRFPVKEFVDPHKEIRIKRVIYFFIVLIMIPSAFIFYNVLQSSFFSRDAGAFLAEIEELVDKKSDLTIIDRKIIYHTDSSKIRIALLGTFDESTRAQWEDLKLRYDLTNCQLDIKVPKDYSAELDEIRDLTEKSSYEQSKLFFQNLIDQKNQEIKSLETELDSKKEQEVDFESIESQVKLLTLDIEEFAFAKVLLNGEGKLDTVPTFFVQWKDGVNKDTKIETTELLRRWFSSNMKSEKVQVIEKN